MTSMRLNGSKYGMIGSKAPAVVPRVSYRSYSPRPRPACHYTSVKERLGEPGPDRDDDQPTPDDQAESIRDLIAAENKSSDQPAAADSTAMAEQGGDEPLGTPWRERDAADQEAAVSTLKGIESAAVAANPEQAGHPEQHKALHTTDYPADDAAAK